MISPAGGNGRSARPDPAPRRSFARATLRAPATTSGVKVNPGGVPSTVPDHWTRKILGEIGRSEYRLSLMKDGSWGGPNGAQDFRTRFSAAGIEVTRRS